MDVPAMEGNATKSLSEMSKAEKLRGFVTEKLAAASREILTVFDAVVAAYEEEASGFRREINRQKKQLELLQHPVSTAGVKRRRNQGSAEEEESKELLENLVSSGPSRSSASRRQNIRRKPEISKAPSSINFKLCILEDPQTNVLTKNVVKKCPILTLKCPRGLQESDFLGLLRSAVPQLAAGGRAFDILTLDKRRRLKPLPLKTVTAEEIHKNLTRPGRSTLYIRLKTKEELQKKTQTEDSSSATSTQEKTEQQTSRAQTPEGSREVDPSVRSAAHRGLEDNEDRGSGSDEDCGRVSGDDSDSSWKPEQRTASTLTDKRQEKLSSGVAAFSCKVCGVPSASEVSLVQHARTHRDEAGGVCGACGESVEAMKDHLESRHKTIDCHLCGESFLCLLSLNEHVAAHSESPEDPRDQPAHRCPTCQRVFELEEQLEAHSRTHSKTFLCGVCGKFLRDNRSLSRHKKTHSVERPHGCRVCGRAFKLPTTLKQHEKIHTDRERSYLCDVCCKMFLTSKQLLIHMRTHTNEKPYHCDECGKGFTTRGPLTIHMRVHTGETPYRCSHCGWSFKRKTHLDNHVAIHTGARPYVCSICGKSCARKTYLNVHMRTHNGERPYKCSVCNKAFTQSHCLKTHMKTHQAAAADP